MSLERLFPVRREPISQKDWDILQAAHDKASRILGRSPKSHIYAERLAHEVFRLFDWGHRDANIMASIAAQSETKLVLQNITEIKVENIDRAQKFIGPAQ